MTFRLVEGIFCNPEIIINDDMKKRAKQKYQQINIDTTKDKRKFGSEAKRLLYGYLGEMVVMDYYGVGDIDDYEYDIIVSDYKVDVKSISCKFKPPEHYLAAVNSCEIDGEHRQDADIYVFVRIREDCKIAWIVGFIECDRFFERSVFVKEGEEYHKMSFDKANVNVLPIKELHKVQ